MRGAAATAIGKIGTAENGRALVPLLADDSTTSATAFLQAIGVLRVREAGRPCAALRSQSPEEGGPRIWPRLSRNRRFAQTDLFQELVQDPDPERKRLAIEGLGRILDASRPARIQEGTTSARRTKSCASPTASALDPLGDRAFLDTIVLTCPQARWARRIGATCRRWDPAILPEAVPRISIERIPANALMRHHRQGSATGRTRSPADPPDHDPSQTVADKANRAVERLAPYGRSEGFALRPPPAQAEEVRGERARVILAAVSSPSPSPSPVQTHAPGAGGADGTLSSAVREASRCSSPAAR